MTVDTSRITDRLRRFADACEDRSPLYAHLARSAANDAEVAEVLTAAPSDGLAHPTLLFAAVHDLVLRGRAPALSAWYPSAGGDRHLAEDPWPTFRATVLDLRAAVELRIRTRRTQTNEVARCSALRPALAAVQEARPQPLAWLDVGTSAGLTLRLPRFGYRLRHGDGRVDHVGPDDAGLTLACDVAGEPPLGPDPRLGWRRGLDAAPVDLTDPDARDWLQACVWPEQTDRLQRLRSAIEIAIADPVELVAGDAVGDLGRVAAEVPADHHLVVSHTWVLAYLSPERRAAFDAELDALAADRDLDRIGMESGGLVPGTARDRKVRSWLGRTTWRAGQRSDTVLAEVDDHGRWLRWGAPAA